MTQNMRLAQWLPTTDDADAGEVVAVKSPSGAGKVIPTEFGVTVGIQGPEGPKGDTGDPGPSGPIGPKGDTGLTGATGATGSQGPQGLKGDQGNVGPAGPTGSTGADSTVPGPAGPQGLQGPEGPVGPASTVPGPTGATGPEGPQGDPGPIGPASTVPGPQGPAGPTGATGATGGTFADAPTDNKLYGRKNAAWLEVTATGGSAATTTFAPTGNIAATNVQTALAEVDTEKVAKAGDTMTGALTLAPLTGAVTFQLSPVAATQQANINFLQSGVGKWQVGKKSNDDFNIYDVVSNGPLLTAPSNGTTVTFGKSVLLAANPTAALGAATKQYVDGLVGGGTAATVTFSPVVGVSSTNVQAAIEELNTEKVDKAGSTMTGGLTIAPASGNPILHLSKTGATSNDIYGSAAGQTRWLIRPGNSTAESGSNAGTDFNIMSYTDAGAVLDTPLTITRSSGLITVKGDPTTNLGVATKQYVDGRPATDSTKVLKAGDTMTGNLTVQPTGSYAAVTLNPISPSVQALINFSQTSVAKWELGKQTDDSFYLYGGGLTAFSFNRTTGLGTIVGDPTTALGIATKQYVDNKPGAPDNTKVLKAGDTMTGALIVNPTTGPASIAIQPTAAAQQALVAFNQGVAGKWQIGKKTDNSFAIIDNVSTIDLFRGTTTSATFARSLTVNPATGNALFNIDPTAASAPAIVYFKQTGSSKWSVGKAIDQSFFIQDEALGQSILTAVSGAGVTIGRPLTLAYAPTVDMHAATKLYVDTKPATDTTKVLKAGDTMTGNLNIVSGGITISPTTGAAGIMLAPQAASQQATFTFNSSAGSKWQLGKQTDDSFFFYDVVATNYIFTAPSGGTTVTFGKTVAAPVVTATSKGSTFGQATGTNMPVVPGTADANLMLYNYAATNWCGMGCDNSGSFWLKVGVSGNPLPAFWVDAATQSINVTKASGYGESVVAYVASGTTAWNVLDAPCAVVAMATGNTTMGAPTNIVPGRVYTIRFQQDGTGGRTVAWNTVFDFAGGAAPAISTAPGAVDRFTFIGRTGGTLEEIGRSQNIWSP